MSSETAPERFEFVATPALLRRWASLLDAMEAHSEGGAEQADYEMTMNILKGKVFQVKNELRKRRLFR